MQYYNIPQGGRPPNAPTAPLLPSPAPGQLQNASMAGVIHFTGWQEQRALHRRREPLDPHPLQSPSSTMGRTAKLAESPPPVLTWQRCGSPRCCPPPSTHGARSRLCGRTVQTEGGTGSPVRSTERVTSSSPLTGSISGTVPAGRGHGPDGVGHPAEGAPRASSFRSAITHAKSSWPEPSISCSASMPPLRTTRSTLGYSWWYCFRRSGKNAVQSEEKTPDPQLPDGSRWFFTASRAFSASRSRFRA